MGPIGVTDTGGADDRVQARELDVIWGVISTLTPLDRPASGMPRYAVAMCGRFTQKASSAELARLYGAVDRAELAGERYNIAPTQTVAAVVRREAGRTIEALRWGLVPSWSERVTSNSRMINARAESLASSPTYRQAFITGRCIVPADGFYEWTRSPDGRRLPFYITAAEGGPLALAGLRATWHDPSGKSQPLRSFTIATTTPNDLMAAIHSRMPVILSPESLELWLDPSTDPAELQGLLRPFAGELIAGPVSTLVNSPANDGPALIEPVAVEG
jgi:putative SOS response-associated peptidase YedK